MSGYQVSRRNFMKGTAGGLALTSFGAPFGAQQAFAADLAKEELRTLFRFFFAVAGAHRNARLDGIGFPLYYMTGMASWGAMTAVISSGARIAQERQVGWTRQLRITPLTTSAYFTAKVLTGYMMAIFSIVVLAFAGTLLGVRLDATGWLTMLGLLLVGLIPFAVMGIMLGHLISVDSLGPAIGGITSLFALFGGVFGQLFTSGAGLG